MCLLNQNCASWSISTICASAFHLANICRSGAACSGIASDDAYCTVTIHTSSQHAILFHQLSLDNFKLFIIEFKVVELFYSRFWAVGQYQDRLGTMTATTAANSSAV